MSAAVSACCARSRSVVCAASDAATSMPSTAVLNTYIGPPYCRDQCKVGAQCTDRSVCATLPAEVRLLDAIARQKRFRVVGQHDAAGLHDIAAMGRHEGHVRILFDEEDRRSLGVD